MAILIDHTTKIICQGLTGKKGTLHSQLALSYGTQIVAGVTPGKGGSTHLGIPIFECVTAAMKATGATASIIYVPAAYGKAAILEAIEAGIRLVVCITEGIPVHDMLYIKARLEHSQTRLIGPNSPGIISPAQCVMGIMPTAIHRRGCMGIISRSGTLTYEAVKLTTELGLGQSTCIGIGGDAIIGTSFIPLLDQFEQDNQTKGIILIGEIGGYEEEEAADHIKQYIKKPLFTYIAGITAPCGKKMGHAGAIIHNEREQVAIKRQRFENAGIVVVPYLNLLREALKKALI